MIFLRLTVHFNAMWDWKIVGRLALSALLTATVLMNGACASAEMPMPLSGYNHTKERYIEFFTVNGGGGAVFGPGEGGGGNTCCANVKSKWYPGMKVKVGWVYTVKFNSGMRPPPPQSVDVLVEPF